MPSTSLASGGGRNEYQNAMERVGGAYFGGDPLAVGGGYFGGGPDAKDKDPTRDLRRYRDSLAHATKEKLYRGLASALAKAGVPVDAGASPEEIVRVLKEKLPNPRKNGHSFKADAKSQEKICKDIAGVLNDEFTPGAPKQDRLIDASLGAVSVCRQVSELVHSMSTGLHSEFLEVHASLKRVVRNLEFLDEILGQLHKKSMGLVDDSALSTGSEKKLTSFDEAYRRTIKERERQMKLLRGFLNVTLAPAKEELALAMRDNDESHDIIQRLKLVPGTSDFADSLAEAVSGLGTVAAISARVDKALKEVGMGVEEYLKSSDIANLGRELDSNMMGDKDVDLGKFLKAVTTLKENFYRRDELARDKHVASAGEHFGDDEFWGGDDDDDNKKSKYDRRIEKRTEERKLIVKEFINKTTREYDRLLRAVKAVGPKLGKEVPISDKLKAVRDAIARLGQVKMGELNLELALIGFFDTADARQRKERFLSGLEDVKRAIETLVSLRVYASSSHYFAPMLDAISSLVRTINYFSDVVAKKYGAAEAAAQQPAAAVAQPLAQHPGAAVQQPAAALQPSAAAPDADTEAAEGGSSVMDDIQGLAEVSRAGVDLDESVNAFLYYFYVAQIYVNLRQTHTELEHYGEKYVNVLGDAVADRINTLAKKEEKTLKNYEEGANNGGVHTGPRAGAPGVDDKPKSKKAIAFIKNQFKCKREFYKALQAIDLYMKAFTDAITASPDDASEIKHMLDGVEVIGRWFVDKTGDEIAMAFDSMRSYDPSTGNAAESPYDAIWGDDVPDNKKAHYYTRITNDSAIGNLGAANAYFKVGVPQLGVAIDEKGAASAGEHVKNVYDNFQALKNVVNAFARIGAKFGGREIAHKVFMSPTQIFKALTNYLKCSALSIRTQGVGAIPLFNVGGTGTHNVANAANRQSGSAAGEELFDEYHRVYFGSVISDGGAGAGVDSGHLGDFATEDKYFVYCIKAMAAKVLTVIGVSDMFNRPSPAYDLTPTRIIVGAGEFGSNPEVNPKAAELYFRLPRLAEFYRRILGFDNADRDDDKRIALLPELEGVFSGLIRLEFLRTRPDVGTTGNYSESELQTLIREVNKVFDHYSGEEEQACTKALTAFVAEINRRYGVVKKADWEQLMKLLKVTRESTRTGELNKTNYAILPGEEDYQSDRRAPSDRYLTGDAAKDITRQSKYSIDQGTGNDDWKQWKMLKGFRERIDNAFADVTPEEFTTLTYSGLIGQARKDMERANDEQIRYRIASELIQGSGSLAGSDVTKTMMFHETVVTGLNTLNLLHRTLYDIRQVLIDSDVLALRKQLGAWLDTLANQRVADPDVTRETVVKAIASFGKYTETVALAVPVPGDDLAPRAGAPAGTYDNLFTLAQSVVRSIQSTVVGGVIAAGSQVDSLSDARKKNYKLFKDMFTTYVLDSRMIMNNLLQAAAGASSTFKNIVDVRFPNTQSAQLVMDFSGASSLARELMDGVRYYIDLFRPHIPKTTLDKFEGADGNGLETGSYYWLEKHLMDEIVSGRSDDYDRDEGDRKLTLSQVSRQANDSFVALVGQNGTSLRLLAGNVGALANDVGDLDDGGAVEGCLGIPNQANADDFYEQYGEVLSALIFYDITADDNSGVVDAPRALAPAAVGVPVTYTYIESLISAARPYTSQGGSSSRRTFLRTGTDLQMDMVNNNGVAPLGSAYIRVAEWQATAGISNNRSLLFLFNQLLAMYLRMFVDQTSGKIYRGLIDSLANGALSQAIMGRGFSMPDLGTVGVEFGRRGDPMPTGVLSQALGMILQRLMADSNPSTQISDHLLSTLSEVPQYVRENYRANLPGFSKLFSIVQKQCEFYKQILAATKIRVQRLKYGEVMNLANLAPGVPAPAVGSPAALVGSSNSATKIYLGIRANQQATNTNAQLYTGGSLNNSVYPIVYQVTMPPAGGGAVRQDAPEGQLRIRFTGILNAIASNCFSVVNAAAGVGRELADDAKYFQTQENSIQDYRARYSKPPLMPLSLALAYAQNGDNDLDRMLPEQVVGTAWFKFSYGTRKMLGQPGLKFGLDDAPGVRKILDHYNSTAGDREKIDTKRYEGLVLNVVQGMQFFTDIKYMVGAMLPHTQPAGSAFRSAKSFAVDANFPAAAVGAAANAMVRAAAAIRLGTNTGLRTPILGQFGNCVYSVGVTAEQSISIVEGSNQRQSLQLITRALAKSDKSQMGSSSREIEQVANIVDMNIMPLNVHALMRTIPLAPLYNYAYTFDQEIALMFGEQSSTITDLDMDQDAAGGVTNTRQVFLKMLQEPLGLVPNTTYGTQLARTRGIARQGLLQRIFRGDDSLGMGRPKFISDQLFNKVLFGSMIPTSHAFDETGPPGAGRMESRVSRVGPNPQNPGFGAAAAAGPATNPPQWGVGAAGNQETATQADLRNAQPDYMGQGAIGVLTYLGQPDKAVVAGNPEPRIDQRSVLKQVQLGANAINKLKMLNLVGKARFDTTICRQLFFITNVQRVLRQKMNQELTQFRNVLVSNHRIVNPSVTEYGAVPPSSIGIAGSKRERRIRDIRALYPANEIATTRQYDNEQRYVH